MLFNSSKGSHIAQILGIGGLWEVGSSAFTPPTAGEIETFVRVVIQVVVGIVTIYATIRKAFQKPESVVQLPAVAAVVVPGPAPVAPAVASSIPTNESSAGREQE